MPRLSKRVIPTLAAVIAAGSIAITAGAHPTRADDMSVSISGFAFNPNVVTVLVGDTITWSNDQGVPHTVSADDGSFDLGVLSPGDTGSLSFAEAGTYTYHCNIHPSMAGTIVVADGGE